MKKTFTVIIGSVITFALLYAFTWYYVSIGAEQFNDPNYSIMMSLLAIFLSVYIVVLSFFLSEKKFKM